MVLAKSAHKAAAGQDSRFPYLVSDPAKQDAIADVRITSLLKKKLKNLSKERYFVSKDPYIMC